MKNKVWFMTPKQEFVNAGTMGLPLSFGIHYYVSHRNNLTIEQNRKMLCLLFSMIGHAPFSMYYHYRCMKRNMKHPIYNTWHALDHTLMHAMSIFTVYANGGNRYLCLLSIVLNINFMIPNIKTVYNTWGDNKNIIINKIYIDNIPIRRRNICITLLSVNLPILLNEGKQQFYKIMTISCGSILPFILNNKYESIRGWGSSIMHLGAIPTLFIMLQSI